MRYVPVNSLREGQKLGKTLYGKNNELLLSEGKALSKTLIGSIKRLGYCGVYIEDDISRDIEIVNVISDKLRNETIKGIKRLYLQTSSGKPTVESKQELHDNIEKIVDELLENKDVMVNMIDLKNFDNYTYAHSVNVAVLSIIIGIALDLNRNTLIKLGLGAILHDIGKIFINKGILNKPGKLTEVEFSKIKKHSMLGYKYIRDRFKLPTISHGAILEHHERYDGTGYPANKCGEDITFFGRIVAIADVYDALTSRRPYRKAMNPADSLEYIMGNSGTAFDSDLVEVFVHKIAPYPVGTTVVLSNGYIGIVLENYELLSLRPKIRVFKIGNKEVTPFEINLKDDYSYLNVTILDVINEIAS